MKKGKKWIFPVGLLLLSAVLIFSACKIIGRLRESRKSEEVIEQERQAVTVLPAAKVGEAEDGSEEGFTERAPIAVDFGMLQEINPDVKAWLYCEDSTINFAILQSDNNWHYLSFLADGTRNEFGSVFMDYRCSGDFSDLNTVLYGHDMQNGTMFGGLELYREQDYYEKHSVMYLLTPEHNYRLDAVCGYLHTFDTPLYELPATPETVENTIWTGIARSTFKSDIMPKSNNRFITLSTCADDYAEARYALVLKMTEIG